MNWNFNYVSCDWNYQISKLFGIFFNSCSIQSPDKVIKSIGICFYSKMDNSETKLKEKPDKYKADYRCDGRKHNKIVTSYYTYFKSCFIDKKRHCYTSRLFCKICFKELIDKFAMIDHFENLHEIEINPCNTCEMVFGSQIDKEQHAKLHTTEMKCEVCKKSFANKQNLVRHLRSIHDKDQRSVISCALCKKNFSKKEYKRHCVAFHDSEPKHPCVYCNKEFQNNGNKSVHEKNCQKAHEKKFIKKYITPKKRKETKKYPLLVCRELNFDPK